MGGHPSLEGSWWVSGEISKGFWQRLPKLEPLHHALGMGVEDSEDISTTASLHRLEKIFQPFLRKSFFSFPVMNKTGLIIFNNTLRKWVVRLSSRCHRNLVQSALRAVPEDLSVLGEWSGGLWQPHRGLIVTGFHQCDSVVFSVFPLPHCFFSKHLAPKQRILQL